MSRFYESSVQEWRENQVAKFSLRNVLADKQPHPRNDYLCKDWLVVPLVVNHQIRTTRIESERALFERLRVAGIADLGGGNE